MAANTAAVLAIKEAGTDLAAIAVDRETPDLTRTAALAALDQLADRRRIEAAQAHSSCPDITAARKHFAYWPRSIPPR